MQLNNYCLIDPLESRRFLAATEILTIVGTQNDDTISVVQNGGVLTITKNGVSSTKAASAVQRIDVNARGGDDSIDLSGSNRRTHVDGGSGDDSIVGSARNDTISGGDDDDLIRGMDGNDRLNGDDDRDTIRGGDGNDRIDGGDGRDRLFGNDGNDRLDADDDFWEDDVFGGAGFDTAEIDNNVGIEDDTEGVEDVND